MNKKVLSIIFIIPIVCFVVVKQTSEKVYSIANITHSYIEPRIDSFLLDKDIIVPSSYEMLEPLELILDNQVVQSGSLTVAVPESESVGEQVLYPTNIWSNGSGAFEEVVIPDKPDDAGEVLKRSYSTGTINAVQIGDGLIKNATSVPNNVVEQEGSKLPEFTIQADGSPEVLIVSTHATEAFLPYDTDWFAQDYTFRSTDNSNNITVVSDAIAHQLTLNGIGVIVDKTQHDYPSYTGSYERSAVTVQQYLDLYPSIKVVLDVHRDAIQISENQIVAPIATINGKEAAQIMIISGCDDGTMNMPNYMENLKFSALLQSQMEGDFEGLTRPVLFDYRKYNQDLSTGSILIEVGGHGNTIEQAIYSGELLGDSLSKVLLSLVEEDS